MPRRNSALLSSHSCLMLASAAAAACLLVLATAARADASDDVLTTLSGGAAAPLVLDLEAGPEALESVASGNETTASTTSVDGGAGRKLLTYKQYLIKAGDAHDYGYVYCEAPHPHSQVVYCYGTTHKHLASRFVAYPYGKEFQLALYGTDWCLTIFSKPQNQVALYKCAPLTHVKWFQLWNVYKTFPKGYLSLRTGPKLSDYGLWWPGDAKYLQARAGCNPDHNGRCRSGVVRV